MAGMKYRAHGKTGLKVSEIGSTHRDGQYVRTRDMKYVVPAFEDILKRMNTDYIDLGMIHYIDAQEDWDVCMNIQ